MSDLKQNNKDVIFYEEHLTKNLIALDAVESLGSPKIQEQRKRVINNHHEWIDKAELVKQRLKSLILQREEEQKKLEEKQKQEEEQKKLKKNKNKKKSNENYEEQKKLEEEKE